MSKSSKKNATKSTLIGKIVKNQPDKKKLKKQPLGSLLPATFLQRSQIGMEMAANPVDPADVGFSTRAMVQANMPHSDPKTDVWIRQNGDFTLTIQSDVEVDLKTGKTKPTGIPYGTIPRLVLIYLCSEAIRTKSRTISLGDNLTSFLGELGMRNQGGKRGDITRFKEQMRRLVSSRIKFQYRTDSHEAAFNATIVKKYFFFWDEKNPDQSTLFRSEITLDADFFEEIIKSKVPLHLKAVAALKNNALGLDLYMWLTYRQSRLTKAAFIKWSDLMQQVGSDYAKVNDFQKKAKNVLFEIQALWKDFTFETKRGGFIIYPSGPHIPMSEKKDK